MGLGREQSGQAGIGFGTFLSSMMKRVQEEAGGALRGATPHLGVGAYWRGQGYVGLTASIRPCRAAMPFSHHTPRQ
jgi:hypothetical protein